MKTNAFASAREAKEFLIGKIVDEAGQEGVPLSEVERKMLYFSETGWTLPGMMKVSEEFDRDYDQDEYEAKIAGLIQNYLRHIQTDQEEKWKSWSDAVEKLNEEDHYLSVMLNAVPQPKGKLRFWLPVLTGSTANRRKPGDRLRLWLTALACVFGALAITALWTWASGRK